ncbi:MAG: 4-hydroxy-tetrahydrodipicolinate reductase [Muribaculaceae bacterium]|jgi:4-hydroxy-tetrahydrodipicolinate reductase|nr:4-hydroxy-tetrahydrodipicolinate reductase [Muribaculaceae bacterium]
MKIAIIGYGKMGHIVERIARERGHDIVSVIDVDNQADFDSDAFRSADVAIEFTTPATAIDNYRRAFAAGVPVVSGSTGWTSRMAEVEQMVAESDASLFWTSNFSVGVNIFFELNKRLARLMEPFPQYRPFMSETHHIHKLDHPSGTAVTLAEGIVEEHPRVNSWTEEVPAADDALIVSHIREGEVPGTHTITWDSPVDSISITHRAKSREGFALGAVMAAEWLPGHKGMQGMDALMSDLLKA